MDYGAAIKTIRKDKMKQNQVEFAKLIGITQSYLSQIEKGLKLPSTQLIQEISKKTNVSVTMMIMLGLSENDVAPDKVEVFKALDKPIKDLIKSMFDSEES